MILRLVLACARRCRHANAFLYKATGTLVAVLEHNLELPTKLCALSRSLSRCTHRRTVERCPTCRRTTRVTPRVRSMSTKCRRSRNLSSPAIRLTCMLIPIARRCRCSTRSRRINSTDTHTRASYVAFSPRDVSCLVSWRFCLYQASGHPMQHDPTMPYGSSHETAHIRGESEKRVRHCCDYQCASCLLHASAGHMMPQSAHQLVHPPKGMVSESSSV